MKNIEIKTGTDKQVAYAKSLISKNIDEYIKWKNRVEEGNERAIAILARENGDDIVTIGDKVSTMTDAGEIIAAFKNAGF